MGCKANRPSARIASEGEKKGPPKGRPQSTAWLLSGHRARWERSPSALLSARTTECPKLVGLGARGGIDRSTWPVRSRAQTKPAFRHSYPYPQILHSNRSRYIHEVSFVGGLHLPRVIADVKEGGTGGQELDGPKLQIVQSPIQYLVSFSTWPQFIV